MSIVKYFLIIFIKVDRIEEVITKDETMEREDTCNANTNDEKTQN